MRRGALLDGELPEYSGASDGLTSLSREEQSRSFSGGGSAPWLESRNLQLFSCLVR